MASNQLQRRQSLRELSSRPSNECSFRNTDIRHLKKYCSRDCAIRGRWNIADDCKLHHDNAPAYIVFLMTGYLAKARVPTISQLLYNSDVVPPTSLRFHALNSPMKGCCFGTTGRILEICIAALKAILKKAYRLMLWNHASVDESMQGKYILKHFSALYWSGQ